MKKYVSYFLILLAAVCWAFIGLFTKQVSTLGFNAMEMVFVKVVASALTIGSIILVRDRSLFKWKHWTDGKYFIGTGIISYTFFSYAYMRSINAMSLGIAAVLLYTAPAFVMILSVILFKEKMTMVKGVAIFLTIVGCVFVTDIFSGQLVINRTGLLFGIGSGIGYALYSIFTIYAIRRGFNSLTITFYTFVFAAVASGLMCNPVELFTKITVTNKWGLILLFAMVTAAIPYTAYTAGLGEVPASQASIIATIEPVVATLIGVLVFQESVTVSKFIGVLLIILSVVLVSVSKAPKSEPQTSTTQTQHRW